MLPAATEAPERGSMDAGALGRRLPRRVVAAAPGHGVVGGGAAGGGWRRRQRLVVEGRGAELGFGVGITHYIP